MDLNILGKAISNETRTELLRILSKSEGLSLGECYSLAINKYIGIHKESIYRALEKLVKSNLIDKEYCVKRKKIVYKLKYYKITICLKTGRIQTFE